MLKAPLPTNSVTTAAIADDAVTASKIDFATLPKPKTILITLNSTTGSQTITGVGFKPSALITKSLGTGTVVFSATGMASDNNGVTTQTCNAIRSEGSSGNQTLTEGSAFLHVSGGGSALVRGQITSFTSDGFVVNIITTTATFGPREWAVTLFP